MIIIIIKLFFETVLDCYTLFLNHRCQLLSWTSREENWTGLVTLC